MPNEDLILDFPIVIESTVPVLTKAHKCAREHAKNGGNICKCKGDVYYGTLESINNGKFAMLPSTSQLTCSNPVFGDPLPGTVKDCFCHGE